MIILDCETYESTISSICLIYGIDRNSVHEFLLAIDLDAEYESREIYVDCDDYLKKLFDSNFGPPKLNIDAVAWFHLTRTIKSSNFSEGILPLGIALPRVWDMLASLIDDKQKKENLISMKTYGVPNFQFNWKTGDELHYGPYAMLVREAAFHAEAISNHDYLQIPEIIEDICNGYREKFCDDIFETIASNLHKCIVKFISNKNTCHSLLAPAILYCWCIIRADEFSPFANTCFDSEGATIQAAQISSVKFL